MKTVTLRELRTHCASVMKWIEAGEEVKISQDGKVIARFVPEVPKAERKASRSIGVRTRMEKSKVPLITAEQKAALFDE